MRVEGKQEDVDHLVRKKKARANFFRNVLRKGWSP
jgi:hypothetical protein